MPNIAYQPGQLLRCVGPWFHERPVAEGHTLYEPTIRTNHIIGASAPSVRPATAIAQGTPIIYLGVWIPDQYYLVMCNGIYAVTCYSVVDDLAFWELVKKGDIDPAACKMGP